MSFKFSIVFLTVIFQTLALADAFKNPPLNLREYKSLGFPSQLDKKTVHWAVETSAESLFERAYMDIGNMSDYMHIHAIFGPKEGVDFELPKRSLTHSPSLRENEWSLLEIKAYLIHTQEFPFLRDNKKYMTQTGKELDILMRNWILWPNGVIERAHLYSKRKPQRPPSTVWAGDLITPLFGPAPKKFEFTFFFFRIHCEDIIDTDTLGIKEDNILQLEIRNEKICLALLNFKCRDQFLYNNNPRCNGAKALTPYYKDYDEIDTDLTDPPYTY